jgi:hypothetical protein
MPARIGAIFVAMCFMLPLAAAVDSNVDCPKSEHYQQVSRYNGYAIQIVPGRAAKGKEHVEFRCLGTITAPQGVRRVLAKDWTMAVDPISGGDINGDGKPEVVFDGHTSGAHCCYEYWIASLSKPPRLLREIRTALPAVFQQGSDGVEIRIPDAAFLSFMLPPDDPVTPLLILRLEGDKLVDLSAQHQPEYDERIAQAKSAIAPADLEKFRQSRYKDKLFTDQLPTVKRVLTVVLNYLYSGRELQAWQALEEMWPATDQARIKAIITERRSRGMLSELGVAAAN